jgi:bifunctional non-homologous end joining protein LigD
MGFVKPQLATPTADAFVLGLHCANWADWVMEEKLDGHRLIVEVEPGPGSLLSDSRKVTAWSRNAKVRALPSHLEEQLGRLPAGVFDGELLVPGHRSYGVTELVNSDRLVFVAFDVLRVMRTEVLEEPLTTRRLILRSIFEHFAIQSCPHLRLVEQRPCVNASTVEAWRDEVWARDGEGLILKRTASRYVPGKRSKDWAKVKQLRSATLTVTGWLPSRGKLNDRGKYAIAIIVDDQGHETTVKAKDDATIAILETEARRLGGRAPFLGRRLRIEYQERTPDGLYRHPRWDRWEDE